MPNAIVVRGARQHNLRNVTVAIPRRAITVVTGPSGSGKSSLAFDTLYAEGQRRYVESLSAYARQFLERMEKPDVDAVEGVAPAVAIEQRNPTRTSRSTVGTATEIHDYLRLLWARVGRTSCPVCGRELRPDTVQSVTDTVRRLSEGTRLVVAFPLKRSEAVTHDVVVDNLRQQGFVRVAVAGEVLHVDELPPAPPKGRDLARAADVCVVVDRLRLGAEPDGRIPEAIATAFREGDGDCVLLFPEPVASPLAGADPAPVSRLRFTERFECPDDGHRAPSPTPQLFSFNNPRGACGVCNGFGATLEYDLALIVPDAGRSLRDGALDPWTKPRYDNKRRALAEFARREGIPMDVPWRDLDPAQHERLLRGKAKGYVGMLPFLVALEEKRYKQYIRVFLRQYQSAVTCRACGGARVGPDALCVTVAGATIADAAWWPVRELRRWLEALTLTPFEHEIADHIRREALDRIRFLDDVGLGYLTLDRATRTLSGGEAQRIGLSNALGARLVDTLYVLDEPSIGLHPRDTGRLLALLERLRDGGNTVVVVEHDLDTIRIADHMIELGPGAGERGGRVVFEGPVARAAESPLTGQYLTGARTIPLPAQRRRPGRWLTLSGARAHNLKDVTLRVPHGGLTVVTGPSGSGKSTLVHDVLVHAVEQALTGETSAKRHLGDVVGAFTALEGTGGLDAIVLIDQEPIGRSPRSNPVTYVKAYDEIRKRFADVPLARQRGYTAGTFSFNVAGGRCDTCEGAGAIEVEMVFLADVFLPCEQCGGKRFKPEVLEVTIFGRSIHDVLQMTVDEAIRFFPFDEKLGQALWHLQQVGLGYLRLGQPATTLSGGEAQRIKIARELAESAKAKGRKLYVMDEPTTGLHLQDVEKLVQVLDRLVDAGHTLVVIEHHLDVIKCADWVVDLGPEAGDAGGEIVAMGTPEQLVANPASVTGRYLAPLLDAGAVAEARLSSGVSAARGTSDGPRAPSRGSRSRPGGR